MAINGHIAGYDPGGNDAHGLAIGKYENGVCVNIPTCTKPNAEAVIERLYGVEGNLLGIGVDTIVCWATGKSGWRPADKWLINRYPGAAGSVMAPNSIFGAMPVNGMAVILALKEKWPDLRVTEAHPKVLLHWARINNDDLAAWLDGVEASNEHERDAVLSMYAACKGLRGDWTHDLFTEPVGDTGRPICPAGPAHYWWPE